MFYYRKSLSGNKQKNGLRNFSLSHTHTKLFTSEKTKPGVLLISGLACRRRGEEEKVDQKPETAVMTWCRYGRDTVS